MGENSVEYIGLKYLVQWKNAWKWTQYGVYTSLAELTRHLLLLGSMGYNENRVRVSVCAAGETMDNEKENVKK